MDITLTRNGVRVTHLTPGGDVITVRDRSGLHNFHLTGPGVNQTTTVAFTGTLTWTLTLTAGTYRFVCDPHAATMRGTFTVSATAPPPARCRVPRVVGRTLATARRLVRRAGCESDESGMHARPGAADESSARARGPESAYAEARA